MGRTGGGSGGGDVPWPFDKLSGDYTPWPISRALGSKVVNELVGKKCRIVKAGDSVNPKVEPGRITIFLDDDDRIKEIYREDPLPLK
ncbi:UNVERIFIED_ORG: hypothetical protein OKW25_002554 [Pseudomonas vranovensis]|nr:hypothetical protein [Pseudomonas vranovensis]